MTSINGQCVLVGATAPAQGATGGVLYIPSAVPHLVLNPSETDPAVAVLARTDPDAQEEITALPQLDDLPHLRPEDWA